MIIQLNGSECIVAESCTVSTLVASRGLDDQPCAVEVNRVLVPRKQHDDHTLHEGDVVEIVTLVGGG